METDSLNAENYCPCCSSDCTETIGLVQNGNGEIIHKLKCNYCDSTFNNVFSKPKTEIIEDNSEIMQMCKSKEHLVDALKHSFPTIKRNMGYEDKRTDMLMDCLINYLNDLDSIDLVKLYDTSSFRD